ncbi:olfactory receptor 14J1-like [Tachyglossus aculeatus]|uniref:olfactory receptor 14J1-like n=1 Tax=Tachyglossus aculeatus TaxID=9261 RepID=UPI0018F7B8C6|nr:olfactory receptor 14J1-like [Tachyglossus aculeatus]
MLKGGIDVGKFWLVHTVQFLLLYIVALTGNLLIIAVMILNWKLHSPIYFFLRHLSILDLCDISTTVSKFIVNSLTNRREISFPGCVLQVMSFDNYVATCLPLRYVVMSQGACKKMVASSWFSGSLSGLMQTAVTFSLRFRRCNEIHQFFCDIPRLLKLSGSDWIMAGLGISVLVPCLAFFCFISIIVSYICIFSDKLRMRSSGGRTKAFSTCLTYLIIMAFFFSTASFGYVKPPSDFPFFQDLLMFMIYFFIVIKVWRVVVPIHRRGKHHYF